MVLQLYLVMRTFSSESDTHQMKVLEAPKERGCYIIWGKQKKKQLARDSKIIIWDVIQDCVTY